jgi:xylose isomerase
MDHREMSNLLGAYSSEKAEALKAYSFNQQILGVRGMRYERLDQLTVELLLGVR